MTCVFCKIFAGGDFLKQLFIIAGLGNPGEKYKRTRHNVGFDTIDLLGSRYNISVSKDRHKGLLGEGIINKQKVILVKPQTFMNLSGECISAVVQWYKIELSRLILVYDDVDLPLGSIRLRLEGSAGTHNGMKSVIQHLGTGNFPRVRIGIDKPPKHWDLADYVTHNFESDERKIVDESIVRASNAVVAIISEGIDKAMNEYN